VCLHPAQIRGAAKGRERRTCARGRAERACGVVRVEAVEMARPVRDDPGVAGARIQEELDVTRYRRPLPGVLPGSRLRHSTTATMAGHLAPLVDDRSVQFGAHSPLISEDPLYPIEAPLISLRPSAFQ